MDEIKAFLLNLRDTADDYTKKRIDILLKNEVVDYCKCPKCGTKFTPEEGFKGGIIMYSSKED